MPQESAFLQISLVLLLAFVAAVASTPAGRDAIANRQPRPLSEVMNELGASLAAPAAATTD
jgi:hypothetical protein